MPSPCCSPPRPAIAASTRAPDATPSLPRRRLEAAAKKPYAELRDRPRGRPPARCSGACRCDLGAAAARSPTDERLRAFKDKPDPRLLALYFQYGRYLLIASSRPGTQPANLQGIWNELVRPPWSSNWTVNINTQMNYWPAETCNLAECHEPLFDLIGGPGRNGRETAAVNYGAAAGWRTTTWTCGGNPRRWAFREGLPDLGQLADERPVVLRSTCGSTTSSRATANSCGARAWPVMQGAAEFCLDWLIEDGRGGLTTCPSFSTENTFVPPDGKSAQTSAGCTMDIALIRELFSTSLEAARALGVDPELRARMEKALARLPRYGIGSHGQLQEWSKDFAENRAGAAAHVAHVSGCIRARRSRRAARRSWRGRRGCRSSGAWRPAARTPAGAAPGRSTSGRAWRMAPGRTNRWRRS